MEHSLDNVTFLKCLFCQHVPASLFPAFCNWPANFRVQPAYKLLIKRDEEVKIQGFTCRPDGTQTVRAADTCSSSLTEPGPIAEVRRRYYIERAWTAQ